MWESFSRFTQNSSHEMAEKTEMTVYQNLRDLIQKDLTAVRNEYFFPAPQFILDLFLSKKRQKKDATLFHCLFNVFVSIFVNLLVLAIKPDLDWRVIAAMTVFRMSVFATPRFVLALHAASHSPLFASERFNYFILNWVMGTFMGIPTGAYPVHHITMHHKEDNLYPLDLSSTMPYQRDNFWHFLVYWARFEIGAWIEVPYWLLHKGFKTLFVQVMSGMIFYWSLAYVAWQIRPAISLWIFIIPQIFLSFLLMFGNFSQHIFVDPDDFSNDYSLTVNCIDSPYNQATFNDGYHIIHHKYPYLHWSKMPAKFLEEVEFQKHTNANSICFREVDWFWIGVFTMTGRLDKLATYFVPLTEEQAKMELDDIVQFLTRRLVPIRDAESEKSGKGFLPFFGIMDVLFGHP